MRVRLYTQDTTPSNFVAEKDIPSYVTGLPDMIVWGNRTFKPVTDNLAAAATGEADYIECFTHVIVD